MELLETTAQSYEIEKIINSSEDYTIIVSPYLKINNRLKPKLSECFKRNNKNLILYREDDEKKEEKKWLNNFSNVSLVKIKNLHAKCYLNEKTALITSMNLYDYSQINNHEIGVKFSIDKNKQEMLQLLGFINNILMTENPNFNFSYFQSRQVYTMGELYAELIKKYDFPDKMKIIDGTYIYMCQIARKLFKFPSEDIKEDKSALKRTAILNFETYLNLRKELIKKGIRKKL